MKSDRYCNYVTNSDVPGTIYKIAYTVGYKTRIIQIRAQSAFLAFKEFKRRMLPAIFNECLIDGIEEKVIPMKRNLKRNRLKPAV